MFSYVTDEGITTLVGSERPDGIILVTPAVPSICKTKRSPSFSVYLSVETSAKAELPPP